MPSQLTKTLKLLIILLTPILIILTAARMLATDQYLAFEYNKSSFPPDPFGYTQHQRFDLASTNVHYVRAHLPNDTLSVLSLIGGLTMALIGRQWGIAIETALQNIQL